MECSICHNNISKKIKCLLCLELFCSYDCMESHIIISHHKKIIQNIMDINEKLNNITNQKKAQF